MKICFVIPARNEEKFIGQCLTSINSQIVSNPEQIEVETIVVDCESTDQSKAIAMSHGAQVISNRVSNAATTRNAGAEFADGDFIAFVDADCILPPSWLERCLSHFANDQVVAAGASQAYSGPSAPWIEQVWTDIISPRCTEKWQAVNWLPAFNLMVRCREFGQIDGFDESLETCEDSDLTFRLAKLGTLRIDHSIQVRHLGESGTISEFIQREMWRSRGNFRSAMKRGEIRSEIKSLFAPTIYVALLFSAFVSPLISIFNLSVAIISFFLFSFLTIAIPTMIARNKGQHTRLISRSVAMAIYLFARGVGPFLKRRRVSR